MKIHPRTLPVQRARCEIELAVLELAEKHGLTAGELMGAIGSLLSSLGKHAVRQERHPDDPDSPGDVA